MVHRRCHTPADQENKEILRKVFGFCNGYNNSVAGAWEDTVVW